MATSLHNNSYPAGHKIYDFGKPYFDYHYYMIISNLSDIC